MQWEELDFEDIEKSLAAKLTDIDIRAVLHCINAKQTLKRLKPAGCVNIMGCGLDSLLTRFGSNRADRSQLSRKA